jgi:hypothetical protein
VIDLLFGDRWVSYKRDSPEYREFLDTQGNGRERGREGREERRGRKRERERGGEDGREERRRRGRVGLTYLRKVFGLPEEEIPANLFLLFYPGSEGIEKKTVYNSSTVTGKF